MLFPNVYFEKIEYISAEFLLGKGIEGVILDVDNTLSPYGEIKIDPAVLGVVNQYKDAGLALMILSNNFDGRVKQAARILGVPHISFGIKPLPFGFLRAGKRLGVPRKKIAVIGDQIFTDVVGANLCGMFSIIVKPLDTNGEGITLRLRRWLEKPILKRCEKNRKEQTQL